LRFRGHGFRGSFAVALVCAAGFVLATGASSASAAQTFGSDLTQPASTTPASCSGGGCTDLVTAFRTGNTHPSTSPISGVVVSFGVKVSFTGSLTFVLGHADMSGNGVVTSTGPTTNPAAAGTYSVPARTPVTAGDQLGLTYGIGGNHALPSGCGTGPFRYVYTPALVQGNPPQAQSLHGSCDELINATVEPDADHDGYGDETQDQCPTNASTHASCPVPVKKKCKKRKHRSLSSSAAKKRCKKHHK